MALMVEGTGLRYVVRRWHLLGVPLPLLLRLGPRATASERVQDSKFAFDVTISQFLTGRIVRYSGLLSDNCIDAC